MTVGMVMLAAVMTLLSAIVNNLAVIGLVALGALLVVAYRQSRQPGGDAAGLAAGPQEARGVAVWDVAAGEYRCLRPVLLADGSTTWIPMPLPAQPAAARAVTQRGRR